MATAGRESSPRVAPRGSGPWSSPGPTGAGRQARWSAPGVCDHACEEQTRAGRPTELSGTGDTLTICPPGPDGGRATDEYAGPCREARSPSRTRCRTGRLPATHSYHILSRRGRTGEGPSFSSFACLTRFGLLGVWLAGRSCCTRTAQHAPKCRSCPFVHAGKQVPIRVRGDLDA